MIDLTICLVRVGVNLFSICKIFIHMCVDCKHSSYYPCCPLSRLSPAYYKLSRNDQQQGFCERSSNNLKISWHVKPYTHIRMQFTPFIFNKKNNLVIFLGDILSVSADVVATRKSGIHLIKYITVLFLPFCLPFFSFCIASSAGLNVGSDAHLSCL